MARAGKLVRPDRTQLVKLQVRRTEQLSPHFMRVVVGGGTIEYFEPRGFDQWFRLFIPRRDDLALDRLPDKVGTIGYLKYLRINADIRPELRNYTVRAFRAGGPDGPEMDIDFVLHGDVADGTAGPGAAFAQTCEAGDWIGLIDEGQIFDVSVGTHDLLLATDETGVPGVAAILSDLPDGATGTAILEVPSDDDVLELPGPAGIEQRWIVRAPDDAPGHQALAEVEKASVSASTYAYVVGESGLATGARRHLVQAGVPKDRVSFCGYYKLDTKH